MYNLWGGSNASWITGGHTNWYDDCEGLMDGNYEAMDYANIDYGPAMVLGTRASAGAGLTAGFAYDFKGKINDIINNFKSLFRRN